MRLLCNLCIEHVELLVGLLCNGWGGGGVAWQVKPLLLVTGQEVYSFQTSVHDQTRLLCNLCIEHVELLVGLLCNSWGGVCLAGEAAAVGDGPGGLLPPDECP